ncbi:MAG: diguanylate cyclase [Anaerolineales bacterium]|nr:MAG: diguanylate cyclase [Anaerolineales bacterium]
MSPPNITYSAFLIIAGTACLFVALLVFQTRRSATGSFALISLLLALAWWDITYAIFWADVPGPTVFFWLDVTYVGVVTAPLAIFVFSLQITHRSKWLKSPLLTLICLEPIIVLLILFTDPSHGLFFAGKRTDAFIQDGGPVFWLNVVFSYSLVLVATIILYRTFTRSSGMYRKQIGMVLLGLAVTWLNSIIFVIGINPLPGADNTPFSFTIAALAFAFSLFRYRLLDIIPVARDVLIEKMTEGVLVIDSQNRIVDMNPAARNMLDVPASMLGESVDKVLSHWRRVDRDSLSMANTSVVFELRKGETIAYVEMRATPIMDYKDRKVGRLVVLHDITRLKNTQNELKLLATRDSLTGVINRGHFMELAEREILRAKRYKRKLSLIMMDLDYFKNVNDTYGHQAGDHVLVELANLCGHMIRKIDVFARLGGEEFALLLPEIDGQAALQLAERLRSSFASMTMDVDSRPFNVTISMGVTEFERYGGDRLEEMLHRADRALYHAKETGRNRVVFWKPELG